MRVTSSGLNRIGGSIQEEFLRELQFPNGLKLYDEMRKNSGVVGGFLRAIGTSFRSVNWFMLPANDTSRAHEHAAFVESCRRDMAYPFSSFVADAITFLPFGFAAMEQWFKRRQGFKGNTPSSFTDNKIGWGNIDLIGHESILEWAWDEDDPDRLIGLIQLAPPEFVSTLIPREKFLLFRAESEKNNPEGMSVLRQAYYHYYQMTRLEAVESISLERTGAGIPTVSLPKGATTRVEEGENSDEAAAERMVASVRVDEQGGVIEPFEWKFRLERPAGRVDPQLFDLAIKRHRASMLMSVLAVFLELGTSRVGSFALAEQGRGFFEVAFESYVMAFEDCFNEEAIPLLMRLNGITEDLPRISHTSIAGTNLDALTTSIKAMTESGYLEQGDPLITSYLKDLMRIPQSDSIEELRKPPQEKPKNTNGFRPDDDPDDEDEDGLDDLERQQLEARSQGN